MSGRLALRPDEGDLPNLWFDPAGYRRNAQNSQAGPRCHFVNFRQNRSKSTIFWFCHALTMVIRTCFVNNRRAIFTKLAALGIDSGGDS
jgi:hypothetical protein